MNYEFAGNTVQPQAIRNKIPCANLRQSTYVSCELLGRTPNWFLLRIYSGNY